MWVLQHALLDPRLLCTVIVGIAPYEAWEEVVWSTKIKLFRSTQPTMF